MKRLKQWLKSRTEEELAYLLSAVSFVLCALLAAGLRRSGIGDVPWIFFLPTLLMIYGFLQYALAVWSTIRDAAYFRILSSAVLILGGGFVLAFSSVATNAILQVPSAAFPHTRAFIGVFCIPVLILAVLPILGILSPPILVMRSYYKLFPRALKIFLHGRDASVAEKSNELVWGMRMLSLALVAMVIGTALSQVGPYTEGVAKAARWYAYNFEAERYSYCTLADDQRIVYVDGERVIRVSRTKDGFQFDIGSCDSAPTTS